MCTANSLSSYSRCLCCSPLMISISWISITCRRCDQGWLLLQSLHGFVPNWSCSSLCPGPGRVHRSGPDQRMQRVWGSEIAVAHALYGQNANCARRRNCAGDHLAGRVRGDAVDARLREPCIEPAGGLPQPDLDGDLVGVAQPGEDVVAGKAGGVVATGTLRPLNLDQAIADIAFETFRACLRGPCVAREPVRDSHGPGRASRCCSRA